ncbi:DUF5677 domain-containing protein [Marivirga arenosa]|uniref:DUF5677 domain-containing protein n=1 Tax=Marivirga arenosa TaxID=3059076 RepID=A0AA51RD56_9BACT|nr:DUF5677 domain-containing protein [Marivirga sp. ABR2-2]WMN07399.1 DUF5677 domain-containing protein [Marivirga sp. ABR2-2]
MDKQNLREVFTKYVNYTTTEDYKILLDIYLELFFKIISEHPKLGHKNRMEYDAAIVLQMMFTKALNLMELTNEISYKSKSGKKLNKIVDPTVIAILVRNIYETTGTFNLIFRNTETEDEKEILYLLWVISGLNYRQKFESSIIGKVNKEKHASEKEIIKKYCEKIESNRLFKSLDKKNQEKIRVRIKRKEYLIEIKNNEVKVFNFSELGKSMRVKNSLLDNIYNYFSQYTHPSNVSVFQYKDMFKRGSEDYPKMVSFNLKISFFFFSIFLADIIDLFPETIKSFESLELTEQLIINHHNTFMRGIEYSINDSWKLLD